MATHHGSEGKVKIGSNAVAEVTEFELEESVELADDSSMGDTWATHIAGLKRWSGSLTCWWDETDTNGQEAMDVGSSVTLTLLPEGDTTGDVSYSGTAIVTGITTSVTKDGISTRAFTFTGTGALTQSTVA